MRFFTSLLPGTTHLFIYASKQFCFMHTNNYYNKTLKSRANSLRKNMTKSEVCLWKYVLSCGQMKGYVFRRQRSALNYIADFYCQPLKLIIEVDGMTHDDDRAVAYDRKREEHLINAGFNVLRFSATDVLRRISIVREVIEDWINDWESTNLDQLS